METYQKSCGWRPIDIFINHIPFKIAVDSSPRPHQKIYPFYICDPVYESLCILFQLPLTRESISFSTSSHLHLPEKLSCFDIINDGLLAAVDFLIAVAVRTDQSVMKISSSGQTTKVNLSCIKFYDGRTLLSVERFIELEKN